MKKNHFYYTFLAASFVLGTISCDDSSTEIPGTEPGGETKGAYVIAASSEDSDYLLQTANIDKGSVTALGNGIESSGNRNWVFYKNKAYSFLYSKGDPGKATSYMLDEKGALKKNSELDLTISITTRGFYDDYIILLNSTRSITDARGTFYFVDAVNNKVNDAITVDTKELAGNGQMAYFTDLAQVGDEIFASYKCVEGLGATNATRMNVTLFDTLWVAVYSYDKAANALTLKRKITDTGRTGFVAGAAQSQHETGLSQADNGNLYAFSSAPIDPSPNSKNLPSGVIRIKKGETEFDKGYFFNIQEVSGGYHLYRVWNVGGSRYALQMYTAPNDMSSTALRTRFAIVDVESKTFNWVTGLPEATTITSVSKPYVSEKEGTIAFALTTSSEHPFIYQVDAATAAATKGVEVISEGVSGIGKLTY